MSEPVKTLKVKQKKKDNNKDKLKTKVIFLDDTISFKTKNIKKEDVFRKNSMYFKDEEVINCMILREKLFPYKCSIPECSVNNDWNNKPLYLMINRKNKKRADLTINNLEFQCPNCYLQIHGLIKWQKQIKERVVYCSRCNYNISNFSDYNKATQLCKSCDQKISSHKKSSITSYSALEECWDSSGDLKAENLNKDYSKTTKQYENYMNNDELEQILGPVNTSQSYFRINHQTKNNQYNNNYSFGSHENANGSDNANNNGDTDNQNHRLSNIESSLALSFNNDNLELNIDNSNIDISQLIKDVENIAQNSDI